MEFHKTRIMSKKTQVFEPSEEDKIRVAKTIAKSLSNNKIVVVNDNLFVRGKRKNNRVS